MQHNSWEINNCTAYQDILCLSHEPEFITVFTRACQSALSWSIFVLPNVFLEDRRQYVFLISSTCAVYHTYLFHDCYIPITTDKKYKFCDSWKLPKAFMGIIFSAIWNYSQSKQLLHLFSACNYYVNKY